MRLKGCGSLLLSLLLVGVFAEGCSTKTKSLSPAQQLITDFYRGYFSSISQGSGSRGPPFSKDLEKILNENSKLCAKKFPGEQCGWGSHADPFLDAQDHGDNLSLESTNFQVREISPGLVRAKFKVIPESDQYSEITYRVIREDGMYVVDEIWTGSSSAREDVATEYNTYLK